MAATQRSACQRREREAYPHRADGSSTGTNRSIDAAPETRKAGLKPTRHKIFSNVSKQLKHTCGISSGCWHYFADRRITVDIVTKRATCSIQRAENRKAQ